MRFPLEVFKAVRQAIPDRPVTVRISGTDWVNGGWDIEQTCAFAAMLEAAGCDAFHIQAVVSIPLSEFPWGQAIRCHWLGPSKQQLEFPSLPSD